MEKDTSVVSENGSSAGAAPLIDFTTDRYGSLKLIDWFDLNRIQNAKVLVIGAGAIGNEVLKNLALLGIGNIFIYDRDTIEMSNLTRSILFRADDCDRLKAEAAADALKKINPDINVVWRNGDIRFDLGLGLIRRMNVVIGCLDNRGARLKMNTDCFRIGIPWIDAGIGQLNGQIRAFSPEHGACYECSFTEEDYTQVGMPCNRLASIYAAEGKIPTTPTIASIVAAVQVQEALKLLDRKNWEGRNLVSHEMIFNGTIADCMRFELMRRADCTAHETITEDEIVELHEATAEKTTVGELMSMVEEHLGEGATLELKFDIALTVDCVDCNEKTPVLKPVGLYFQEDLVCEKCGKDRTLNVFHTINRKQSEVFDAICHIPLRALNIPDLDIFVGWSKDERGMAFELTGDEKLLF